MEIWVGLRDTEKALVDSFFKDLQIFAASINLALSKIDFKNIWLVAPYLFDIIQIWQISDQNTSWMR